MHRVVITGLGCQTPIGSTPSELWQTLAANRTGIVALPAPLDPTLKFFNAGRIASLDTSSLTGAQLQATERSAQLALLSAAQALSESSLLAHHDPARTALILGCSTAGRQAEEPQLARVYTEDARVHPLTIPRAMASNGTSQIAIAHRITGPAFTLTTACASGAHAIALAFQMVRSGLVSAALAGAHESPLTHGFLRAWDSMRVVSPTGCRPFSADRDGMILAEGAAILTLETLAAAQARNALIYAELLGCGMSTDAFHITQPRPAGPAQAIAAAFADAGLAPTKLAYINAHGTGTRTNDAAETEALTLALGADLLARTPLSSTKGAHGHALGASSAIEVLIAALALHHRLAPPTVGTAACDPALAVDLVLGTPRPLVPGYALSTSLAFGGLNVALLLGTAP